jgi:hypothetical protein
MESRGKASGAGLGHGASLQTSLKFHFNAFQLTVKQWGKKYAKSKIEQWR